MQKLKQLICLLVLSLFAFGCSKDPLKEDALIETIVLESPFKKFIEEYNINKKGLTIEFVTNGVDTSQIFFNGRINDKLWIGAYEKESKKNLLDWTESVELDTVVNVYKGYGEYDDFWIKGFRLYRPYKIGNSLCFILYGIEHLDGFGKAMSDLYFVNGTNLKKYTTYNRSSDGYYQDITPWHQGVVVKLQSENHVCFDMQGDSLFTINSGFGIKDSYSPISYEECIDFGDGSIGNPNLQRSFFKRINLKTNEVIWETRATPLNDLPENTRFDSYTINKSNNEWSYDVRYTLFDGTKKVATIRLNIENGELI